MEDSISYKLSWEMVAMNDAGEASLKARLSLEIAMGVANANDTPAAFTHTMNSIIKSVSDAEMQRLLTMYTKRGLQS